MGALLTCPCICSRLVAEDTGAENQSTGETKIERGENVAEEVSLENSDRKPQDTQ